MVRGTVAIRETVVAASRARVEYVHFALVKFESVPCEPEKVRSTVMTTIVEVLALLNNSAPFHISV